ncbi:MAG: nitrous oxide-stimulated promoter family protein [Candidatus Cryptobacteroides sp.]|uniref:nitrous oxide-stimulated promoter family protein n=1 Tax=Candidatus Cryptobacteroides sp. TaxID=2952915 RepID=UPI002A819504|nr:nitrous oxide-stimulated promoter family protein [Candidatus Cryptobacteroides sp.]MDY5043867.1 nitrous oxide-stimulated promoter family protein [Candidatus Cryptobacteroides sp.]
MNRIDWEKRTVRHMIELWCRKNHGGQACCEMGSRGGGQESHGGGGEGSHGGQGSHECQVGHGGPGLCGECRELLEYSLARLEHCKFGNAKTKCHKCPVHCYRPDMREKIRTVMRFSGPRMLLYHPLEALRYLFSR